MILPIRENDLYATYVSHQRAGAQTRIIDSDFVFFALPSFAG